MDFGVSIDETSYDAEGYAWPYVPPKPPKKPKHAVHFSGARPDWNTPQVVIDLLAPLGPIALDPCSNPASIVPAAIKWELERDGDSLPKDWIQSVATWCVQHYHCRGYVVIYVNPPYGRPLRAWMKKCAAMADRIAELGLAIDIVALIPSRTETLAYETAHETSNAIAFWKRRIVFIGATAGAPFPSALIYWGDRASVFQDTVAPRCLV